MDLLLEVIGVVAERLRRNPNYKPGTPVPMSGIYWCTVCKKPERFSKDQEFPKCQNICGRGYWHFVQSDEKTD